MAKKSIGNSGGGRFKPLSRAEIVYAQSNTKSNRQAAKFLGVGMERYKRYAKIYNLFDSHANPLGIGINKGFARRSSTVPLRDIFANKHPRYSVIRLKNRMVARKMLANECAMCGFCEKRITDGKIPLLLTFKDGTRNYDRNNLWLLCYNCLFLTTGAPQVAHRGYIEKSFENPEAIPKRWQVTEREADVLDPPTNTRRPGYLSGGQEDHSTDDLQGFDDIRDEVLRELGRDS
jgi:hypothetical protein